MVGTTEAYIAQVLLETEAVMIRPTQPFTYASGMKSPIYCDNRRVLSFPDKRQIVVHRFLETIEREGITYDVIAGVATAGIPWASIIADRLNAPLIYVRDKAKGHGKENQIEGKLEPGQRALIIEDHISTGGSSIKAVQAVRNAGGIVEYCLAITTYEMSSAQEAFEAAQCKLRTQTRLQDLVREAVALEKIGKDQTGIIEDWKADTKGWGKKHGFE